MGKPLLVTVSITILCNLQTIICKQSQTNLQYSGIVCPNLENPEYGTVSLSGNTPGSKATHRCNFGFKLVGEEVRNCQTNGEWDGEAPTCMRTSQSDFFIQKIIS